MSWRIGGGQRTRCLGAVTETCRFVCGTRCLGAVTETCRFVCGNRYDISALRYEAGRGPADVMCSLLLRGVSSGGSVVSLRVRSPEEYAVGRAPSAGRGDKSDMRLRPVYLRGDDDRSRKRRNPAKKRRDGGTGTGRDDTEERGLRLCPSI